MSVVRYVEHGEDGHVVHACEVFVTAGPDAPPPVTEPIREPVGQAEREAARQDRAAQRVERDTRVEQLTAERAQAIRDHLDSQPHITVLPAGEPLLALAP